MTLFSFFIIINVSLDLSDYDGVLIETLYTIDIQELCARTYIKKTDVQTYLSLGLKSASDDNGGGRRVGVNNTGVTFGDMTLGSTKWNYGAIPYKIYGVKSYLVGKQTSNDIFIVGKDSTTPVCITNDGIYNTSLIADFTKLSNGLSFRILKNCTIKLVVRLDGTNTNSDCFTYYKNDVALGKTTYTTNVSQINLDTNITVSADDVIKFINDASHDYGYWCNAHVVSIQEI